MTLPRLLIQMLLLPILALMLTLVYVIAWVREAVEDMTLRRAPVVVSSQRFGHRARRED